MLRDARQSSSDNLAARKPAAILWLLFLAAFFGRCAVYGRRFVRSVVRSNAEVSTADLNLLVVVVPVELGGARSASTNPQGAI